MDEIPEMVGRDDAARAAWAIASKHSNGAISVAMACEIAQAMRAHVRDALTYLYAECTSWDEDVDGDCVDGQERVYINHDVRIRNSLLDELIDMASIKRARYDETALEALKRASDEDAAKFAVSVAGGSNG